MIHTIACCMQSRLSTLGTALGEKLVFAHKLVCGDGVTRGTGKSCYHTPVPVERHRPHRPPFPVPSCPVPPRPLLSPAPSLPATHYALHQPISPFDSGLPVLLVFISHSDLVILPLDLDLPGPILELNHKRRFSAHTAVHRTVPGIEYLCPSLCLS